MAAIVDLDALVQLYYECCCGKRESFTRMKDIAATGEHPLAKCFVMRIYTYGSQMVAKDQDLARSMSVDVIDWVMRNADDDSSPFQPYAEFILGTCYAEGLSRPKNQRKGFIYYKRSAERGYAAAQNNLGVCYSEGEGTKADAVESNKWYRLAAEQGYPTAQDNLADSYASGIGIEKDLAEAVRWFRRAAEKGFMKSINTLARMYLEGEGVTKNYDEAIKLLRRGVAYGSAVSLYYMSFCYQFGCGVDKDAKQSIDLLQQSAALQDEDALYRMGIHFIYGTNSEDFICGHFHNRVHITNVDNEEEYYDLLPKDVARGISLIEQSAIMENGTATEHLIMFYLEEEQYALAYRWMLHAATFEDPICVLLLGIFLFHGFARKYCASTSSSNDFQGRSAINSEGTETANAEDTTRSPTSHHRDTHEQKASSVLTTTAAALPYTAPTTREEELSLAIKYFKLAFKNSPTAHERYVAAAYLFYLASEGDPFAVEEGETKKVERDVEAAAMADCPHEPKERRTENGEETKRDAKVSIESDVDLVLRITNDSNEDGAHDTNAVPSVGTIVDEPIGGVAHSVGSDAVRVLVDYQENLTGISEREGEEIAESEHGVYEKDGEERKSEEIGDEGDDAEEKEEEEEEEEEQKESLKALHAFQPTSLLGDEDVIKLLQAARDAAAEGDQEDEVDSAIYSVFVGELYLQRAFAVVKHIQQHPFTRSRLNIQDAGHVHRTIQILLNDIATLLLKQDKRRLERKQRKFTTAEKEEMMKLFVSTGQSLVLPPDQSPSVTWPSSLISLFETLREVYPRAIATLWIAPSVDTLNRLGTLFAQRDGLYYHPEAAVAVFQALAHVVPSVVTCQHVTKDNLIEYERYRCLLQRGKRRVQRETTMALQKNGIMSLPFGIAAKDTKQGKAQDRIGNQRMYVDRLGYGAFPLLDHLDNDAEGLCNLGLSHLYDLQHATSKSQTTNSSEHHKNTGKSAATEEERMIELKLATELLRRAADLGNARAKYCLGWCYRYGEGVLRDRVKAAALFHESAQQGYSRAQYQLGLCYWKGKGVDVDLEQAEEWLTRCIAQDDYPIARDALQQLQDQQQQKTKAEDNGTAQETVAHASRRRSISTTSK